MTINRFMFAFLFFALIAIGFVAYEDAVAMDRVKPCLLPDGRTVEVPKSSCRMYHETTQVRSSNATYAKIAENLELNAPGDCNPSWPTETYALCMMREQSHARDVVQLAEAMGSPLEMQNAREERALRDKLHKREMWFKIPAVVADTRMALGMDNDSYNGHGGDTFIAGDNFNVGGKAGGGSGGAEGAGGGGYGASVNKTGDNALVFTHKNGRTQATLASPSSVQDQDNRREGTEFQPAAAEGSNATFSPDNRREDNDSLGSLGL